MKERSILFSTAMVRAMLAGKKCVTRRLFKLPSGMIWDSLSGGERDGDIVAADPSSRVWWNVHAFPCPYGVVGDRLFVREAWAYHPDFPESARRACYRADVGAEFDVPRWRPSIHMPFWACRLTLEISGLRVERLQDISEDAAAREGAEKLCDDIFNAEPEYGTYRAGFANLWDRINGAGSWGKNPWVWVIEFRVV